MDRPSPTFKALAAACIATCAIASYGTHCARPTPPPVALPAPAPSPAEYVPRSQLTPFESAVLADAESQTAQRIVYRAEYYPGGDPPARVGVCTDVAIHAFRAGGVDLKRLVNADIRDRRSSYSIRCVDHNIDYRRCRNLAVFLRHNATRLPTTKNADWRPGDIVIFDTLDNGFPNHVALVSNSVAPDGTPKIIHHIEGHYVVETPFIHVYPILYHFRWTHAYTLPTPPRHVELAGSVPTAVLAATRREKS